MYYEGIFTYDDIPDDFNLDAVQSTSSKTSKTQKTNIDKSIIKTF